MKQRIRLYESDLRRLIKESVKKYIKENKQYDKGYKIGTRLAQTRIQRYGEQDGSLEIEKLINDDETLMDKHIEYNGTADSFLKGRLDGLVDFYTNIMNKTKGINESIDPVNKIQQLIDAANNAYTNALKEQDGNEYPLMDKRGNTYGLSSEITLNNRGYVIIPFVDNSNGWGDYSDTVKIRVLHQVDGQMRIIQGWAMEEGWRDVQKILKQIIRDAQIGIEHFKNYDPSWEDAESEEDYKSNINNLKDMNKQIGRNSSAGMNYINKDDLYF